VFFPAKQERRENEQIRDGENGTRFRGIEREHEYAGIRFYENRET